MLVSFTNEVQHWLVSLCIGGENNIAISLIVQHVHTQLQLVSIFSYCKIFYAFLITVFV